MIIDQKKQYRTVSHCLHLNTRVKITRIKKGSTIEWIRFILIFLSLFKYSRNWVQWKSFVLLACWLCFCELKISPTDVIDMIVSTTLLVVISCWQVFLKMDEFFWWSRFNMSNVHKNLAWVRAHHLIFDRICLLLTSN